MTKHPLSLAARFLLAAMVEAESDICEEEARYGVGSTMQDLMDMLAADESAINPALDELRHCGMLRVRYEVAGGYADG